MAAKHDVDWVTEQRAGYRIHQSGDHVSGTYMRVYVPDTATKPGNPLKSIVYLHGFALCIPDFYEEHMLQLVKEGYIIFFPDFQPSFYRTVLPSASPQTREDEDIEHWKRWYSIATGKKVTQQEEQALSVNELLSLDQKEWPQAEEMKWGPGLEQPMASDVRRVAWVLLLLIGFFKLLGFIRQEYSKNIIHLLSTVGISLFQYPTCWLANAVKLTENAWKELTLDYPHWATTELSTFAFGHSIGGLIALSVPSKVTCDSDPRVVPQKIVVADPAPSTLMGIPGFAIWLLRRLHSPFTQKPIEITSTGEAIKVPVAILHGGSDKLVTPQQWVLGTPSNYDAISNSVDKAIYFSYSNPPGLIAFHNQAVTSTQFYGDGLMREFGGVSREVQISLR
ncbi:hypothetical protein C1752_14374 [Acaryochloris thomasi RCC1774]|uniref:Uncharacterized protein n=1 Tax=Acaryochloris thomasi RCC1774 TaxID=1764569 RepID=A0A2W1JN01_9CYAN|nr:hypothetical protein [Acaryochloris thomasi]PZD70287.1 hypothetical protein C1752_14374 [Acaryochloris thomasi RCC1774]